MLPDWLPTLQKIVGPHLFSVAATVLGPRPEVGLGMPRDVSLEGWRADKLINITLVFVTLLFAVMVAWMLWSCILHGRGHTAQYDHGESRRSLAGKAAVVALVFFGVDGNLFVNSTLDLEHTLWNFAKAESHPDAVLIEINAHQWAWDARYAGPDGKFNTADDIVTLNDIRVPVDTPVIFQLTAVDVLHSLYIPNMRVKQDVVPGTVTRAWFQAKEVGQFDIGCAQHCGVHHYKMKGQLTVLPRAEYDQWKKEASALSERAYDAEDTAAHWGWDWRAAP